jgi:PAS domain S-box-containing protein/putative nucleotidyltransferase with HDIG domain
MMATSLRVLAIEDSREDIELLELELKRGGYEPYVRRVDTAPAVRLSLKEETWDIIISDYSMPGFNGMEALEIYRASGLDIPFILLSGVIGEDIAAEVMVRGAHDYVMKDNKARLVPAIERELRETFLRRTKKEAESRFHSLFETMAQGVVYQDASGRIITANSAAERILGLSLDQMLGRTSMDPRWQAIHEDGSLFPGEDHPAMIALRTGRPVFEAMMGVFHPREERYRWIVVNAVPQFRPGESAPFEVYATFTDITERKLAEEALLQSELKYRELVNELPLCVFETDLKGQIKFANKTAIDGFGYSEMDVQSGIGFTQLLAEEDWQRSGENLRQILTTGVISSGEYTARRKDGSTFAALITSRPFMKDGRPIGLRGIVIDITERKRTEDAVMKSKKLLQAVVDATPDWIFVKDQSYRYTLVNKSFAKSQYLIPQDMIGRLDTEFWSEDLCLGNVSLGIRGYHAEDDDACAGRIFHDPNNITTMGDGSVRVFDTIKMPLFATNGDIYGILGYSRDVTERQEAEERLRKSFEKIEKMLLSTVEAMAAIIEQRDPYTAGHQKRVAKLACAIAEEICLPPEIIEDINIGSMLHDLGKIYVPSEILSKPGKLSEIEFNMIKTHPQVGYEIIKKIDFPTVVAEMIWQHHERINGSGYPDGLKGEAICIEAKCLAVSDVVEAMSSHRPYRSSLGIDKALEEIAKNRGVLYDESVVDACLKLFRKKGFAF